MKCSICGRKIETLFLTKINGTYVKDNSGKLKPICSECQKRLGTREKILAQLG